MPPLNACQSHKATSLHTDTRLIPQCTQAYLSGVDDDDMLILDLYADVDPIWSKTDSYFGYRHRRVAAVSGLA
jgi:hypothetical protein